MKTIQILVCTTILVSYNFLYTTLVNAVEQKNVTVTVLISPQYRTIKVGGTLQFTIQGLYNGKPIVNSEELVGDVEWLYVGEQHTATHNISIVPQKPQQPT
jgi:hypothetical protein